MSNPPFDPNKPFTPVDAVPAKPPLDPSKPFDPVDESPDWGGIVKMALNEAKMGDDSKIRSLMSDPITQAKALPYLASSVSTMYGSPTAGYVGGRALSDAALASYGRPDQIPSFGQHLKEAGTSLALEALPMAGRWAAGKAIGGVENAAGVPPPQDIPSLPKPKAGDPVSGGIDSAIESVKEGLKNGGTPTFWKQIKDQIDSFYALGKDARMTTMDNNKLAWLSNAVQHGLNESVPGRSIPAGIQGQLYTIPNAIQSGWKALPSTVKAGLGIGAAATPWIVAGDLLRRTLSGGR